MDTVLSDDDSPVLTGMVDQSTLDDGGDLTVTVDGVDYTTANGLVLNGDGTWSLDLAAAGVDLPEDVYEVTATLSDAAGNETVDATANEVEIDLKAPDAQQVFKEDLSGPFASMRYMKQRISTWILNELTMLCQGRVLRVANGTFQVARERCATACYRGLRRDARSYDPESRK